VSRVQLALDVTDLDAAIAFYRAMLGVEPAKVRPGYANFAVADPPLKLVLIEGATGGTLNHLGVEVASSDEVAGAADRLAAAGLTTDERAGETCCYATQDKVWVHDPDGAPWEVYTVLADADRLASDVEVAASTALPATACC
jgi:catechol 2,3-dioxygenase-like lactoylglutathione lyase family enzyme